MHVFLFGTPLSMNHGIYNAWHQNSSGALRLTERQMALRRFFHELGETTSVSLRVAKSKADSPQESYLQAVLRKVRV